MYLGPTHRDSRVFIRIPGQLYRPLTRPATLEDGGLRYARFLGMFYLVIQMGASLGEFFSAVGKDAEIANVLGTVMLAIMVLFSGFLLVERTIPRPWIFAYYVSGYAVATVSAFSFFIVRSTFFDMVYPFSWPTRWRTCPFHAPMAKAHSSST